MRNKEDKSEWAIGGGVLIGIGYGMLYLPENPMAFVASLLIGLGVGLIATSFISMKKK